MQPKRFKPNPTIYLNVNDDVLAVSRDKKACAKSGEINFQD